MDHHHGTGREEAPNNQGMRDGLYRVTSGRPVRPNQPVMTSWLISDLPAQRSKASDGRKAVDLGRSVTCPFTAQKHQVVNMRFDSSQRARWTWAYLPRRVPSGNYRRGTHLVLQVANCSFGGSSLRQLLAGR